MRLVHSLMLWLVLLTIGSTAGLGLTLASRLRNDGKERFDRDVHAACESVKTEVAHQAESDRKLVTAACRSGELVDRVITWIENGELVHQRVSLGTTLVENERVAFDLNELTLVTGNGDILGSAPIDRPWRPRSELDLRKGMGRFELRASPLPVATVARCRSEHAGTVVGLVAARHLVPLLDRLRSTLNVTTISIGEARGEPPAHSAQASCTIADGSGVGVHIVVTKNNDELQATLSSIDRTVAVAVVTTTGIALLVALAIAGSLGRPLTRLASEASKVASDQASPLRIRGYKEISQLGQAFNKMLEDLSATRSRLAATSRVAAWREVARRVAHEVKNPLAPIRAAVETLRRLRARQDPAFDDYFDEATRTVLDEVHRIAHIVTEFTSFARLPSPRPTEVDLVEIVKDVLALQKPLAGECVLEQVSTPVPKVRADRDQIVQVLVNLVQNAVEATRATAAAKVVVRVASRAPDVVEVTVEDNGPGIAKEIAPRLFEPYATTKAEGTGLGLAIAQRIAIDHAGELAYFAPERGGAGFRLTLPVAGPVAGPNPAETAA